MEHLHVAIVPRTDETPALVRVGSAEFPVVGYVLDTDPESGAPLLSLALAPDSLSIGEQAAPPTAPPSPPARPAVGRWGDGTQPDPREGMPGWPPTTLSGQVAGHAERVALREMSPMAWLRRIHGEGGSTAVTA